MEQNIKENESDDNFNSEDKTSEIIENENEINLNNNENNNDKNNQSEYEELINSIFEDEPNSIKKLRNLFYQSQISSENKTNELRKILTSFKDIIFDESKSYKKRVEKDITPIKKIEECIKDYSEDPEIFFILLNPLLDMYKCLDENQIKDYTKTILDLLNNKNDIILKNFNELFEIVIFLISRQQDSVKKLGNDLNQMLKTALTKSVPQLRESKIFNFDSFEKKIKEKTSINQPILDGFLLDWILEICKIESFYKKIGQVFNDLIQWILKAKNNENNKTTNIKAHDCDKLLKKKFLEYYLNYYKEESQKTNECILSFIKLVKNKSVVLDENVNKEYKFLQELIIKFNSIVKEHKDTNINRNFFKKKYLDADIKKNQKLLSPTTNFHPKTSRMTLENSKSMNKNNIVNSFDCLSQDSENKSYELSELIPLDILNDFMKLITQCNDINKEEQIYKLNSELKKLVELFPDNYEKFNAKEFLNTIIRGIENPDIINKEYLLDWYQLLCEKYGQNITDDSILAIINSVIKAIKNNQNEEKNYPVPKDNNIIQLMFQKLIKLDTKKIFSLFADTLNKTNDYFFISQIDGYLNNYLITASKAEDLRNNLILYGRDKIQEHKPLYEKIYKIFAYNPMCLLIFSIITEYYVLSWNLLLNFMKIKLDDDFYIYLIEFVQLLENSQSNHIRMLLLHPHENIYLAKTLYGILTLLPQGKAYNILSDRLYSIKGLFKSMKEYCRNFEETENKDVDYFINIFLDSQKRKKVK